MRVRVKCVVFLQSPFLFLFFFEKTRCEIIIMKSFEKRGLYLNNLHSLSFLSFSSSSYFINFLSIFIVPFSSHLLSNNRIITFSFFYLNDDFDDDTSLTDIHHHHHHHRKQQQQQQQRRLSRRRLLRAALSSEVKKVVEGQRIIIIIIIIEAVFSTKELHSTLLNNIPHARDIRRFTTTRRRAW